MRTRMIKGLVVVGLLELALLSSQAHAEENYSRPTIIAGERVQVRGRKILLGDIAKITVTAPEQEELLKRLQTLPLGDSPPPLTTTTLLAPSILQAIESAGISRDTIGYSIPNVITVERAGREVTKDEVLEAARQSVTKLKDLDIQVREVSWPHAQVIPLGETRISVEQLAEPSGGKLATRVEIGVDGQPQARFLATAMVDDWREVPVSSRTLERGMLVSPEDLRLVRLNLFKHPGDVVPSLESVLGKRVIRNVGAGETFRKSMLEIPPVVSRGKRVVVKLSRGPLRATASAVALDNGIDGETIRVRNDSSGKILKARVIKEGEVEVIEQ